MQKVTGQEISDMVRHWLETPPNAYLGSGYGCDLKSLLQKPNSAGLADAFIAKMIEDVPVLGSLPEGAINIYAEDMRNDAQRLIIDINGALITIDGERVV